MLFEKPFPEIDISSQAPGKKDYIILTENGMKSKVQKLFLTMTMGETYEQFKLAFPNADREIYIC